jgi:hypothetical protein
VVEFIVIEKESLETLRKGLLIVHWVSLIFMFFKTIRKIKITGCSRSTGTSYPEFPRLRRDRYNFGSTSKMLATKDHVCPKLTPGMQQIF